MVESLDGMHQIKMTNTFHNKKHVVFMFIDLLFYNFFNYSSIIKPCPQIPEDVIKRNEKLGKFK